jgi:P pilus assembly chaperone PapD
MNLKKHINQYQIIIAIIGVIILNSAHAEMLLDNSIIVIDESNQRQDISVKNTSEIENLYVNVELYKVEFPGTKDENLIKVEGDIKRNFIVTPTKLVVPPGDRKLVRFLNISGLADIESVYRVNFTPVSKPQEVNYDPIKIDGKEIRTGVQVVIAYQVLVLVSPKDPKVDLSVTREGQIVTLKNQGTTNVLLFDGKQCHPVNTSECQDLTSFRIYPENTKSLELPYDTGFTMRTRSLNGIKQTVFD